MDNTDLQPPPYKKIKAMHTSMDGTMDDTIPSAIGDAEPVIDATDDHQDAGREQLRKEVECGITEFVSPELQGFTGILKKRYTDFLVNEILPSGLVVHLDNLKGPSRSKQAGRRNDAKNEFPTSIGKKFTNDTPHIEPTLSAGNNGDEGFPNELPHSATEEPLSSYSQTQEEVSSCKIHGPENTSQESQLPKPAEISLEPSSGPRQKGKVHMRQTSTELILVEDKEDFETSEQVSESVSEQKADGSKENVVSPEASASLNTEVLGASEDSVSKATQEPPGLAQPSSVADWQAYADVPVDVPKVFQLSTKDRDLLISYLGVEVVDSTLSLYNRILNSPHRKAKDYGTVKSANISDREIRTKIHQAIRGIFNSRLESVTNDDGTMTISATLPRPTWSARAPTSRNDGRRKPPLKGKPGWQELGGDFLHFSLYKENKDTMEVISYLARQLKMRPQSFQFAGTKDRRAITVQRVSIFRVFADRVIAAGRTLRNAKIGNFEYQPHGLQLGELTGNEFVVTLRDCRFVDQVEPEITADKASQIVGTAIENLKAKGFINYYGLQRFGTFSTRTDSIGVKMLQGDFKAAVDAILDFSSVSLAAAQGPMSGNETISHDDMARAHALHEFKTTGRLHPIIEDLPRKFSAESCIIRHLSHPERSNDYLGALQSISRNLRLMYVHAYQSLVWNVAASERWKRYGSKVIEGDLVLIEEHKEKLGGTTKPEEFDADGEAIVQPADDDRAYNAEDIFTRARALTLDEANSGDYSVFDIVLPMPGFDILYPANEIAEVYKDFMASERGGGLDPFDMRRKWKDISLSGGYRKLLARPGDDVSYEIKTYQNENEQFVQTDLDRMIKDKPQPQYHQHQQACDRPSAPGADTPLGLVQAELDRLFKDTPQPQYYQHQQASDHPSAPGADDPVALEGEAKKEGGKIAVVLKLQLGTSQYATMALRELMKVGGVQTYKPDYGGGR